ARRCVVRGGCVGLGAWGAEHARAWAGLPGVELVALCDRDEGRVRDVAEDLGVAVTSGSAEALAREIDLDLVSIVTHEDDRVAVTLPFFERGVHALVEKPFAVKLEDAETLRDAAAASDVYVM